MEFKKLSEIEPHKTGLVSYNKLDGYFTFTNKDTKVTYDYYCRTLQDFEDLLRQLSCKKWYTTEIQIDVFNLYDSIVRK